RVFQETIRLLGQTVPYARQRAGVTTTRQRQSSREPNLRGLRREQLGQTIRSLLIIAQCQRSGGGGLQVRRRCPQTSAQFPRRAFTGNRRKRPNSMKLGSDVEVTGDRRRQCRDR